MLEKGGPGSLSEAKDGKAIRSNYEDMFGSEAKGKI